MKGLTKGIIAALAVVLLLVGIKQYLAFRDHQTLLEERRLARLAGIPIEPDDLRRIQAVPEEENAATFLRRAHETACVDVSGRAYEAFTELLEAYDKATKAGTQRIGLRGPMPRGLTRALESEYEALAGPLSDFLRGTQLSRCDWSRRWEDGIAMSVPEFPSLRGLCKILCLRARLLAAKDPTGALRDLTACARLSRLLRQDPTTFAWTVSILCGRVVMEAIEGILNEFPNDPFWKRHVPELVETLRIDEDLRMLVHGKVVEYRASLELVAGPKGLSALGIGQNDLQIGYAANEGIKDKVEAIVLRETRAILSEWPSNSDDYEAMVAAVRAPSERIDEAMFAYCRPLGMPSGGTADDKRELEISINSVFTFRAKQRMLKNLALAIRYSSPDGTLKNVLPTYGTDTLDPFARSQTFRTQSDGKSVKLYSVGINRVDDKGQPYDSTHPSCDDIVIEFPFKAPPDSKNKPSGRATPSS